MEGVVGQLAGQSQGVGLLSDDTRAPPGCEVNTLITPNCTAFQVHSSG